MNTKKTATNSELRENAQGAKKKEILGTENGAESLDSWNRGELDEQKSEAVKNGEEVNLKLELEKQTTKTILYEKRIQELETKLQRLLELTEQATNNEQRSRGNEQNHPVSVEFNQEAPVLRQQLPSNSRIGLDQAQYTRNSIRRESERDFQVNERFMSSYEPYMQWNSRSVPQRTRFAPGHADSQPQSTRQQPWQYQEQYDGGSLENPRHQGETRRPEDARRSSGALYQPESPIATGYARLSDDFDIRSTEQGNRSHHRSIEAEIINADRRMEKWHLTFSGDARQRSLEDFLHKIRRLARMDRISDEILLQRIHTILRGEAYDWYLCYADEFLDWADFEERIRYMYGNPNRDQGNRQKIYERKQQRNETFLTFKMEVERLNKLLSSPLDQTRLFEIIWDNMRPHYRSRLACRTVTDLRMLEYYAYRIDANDPTFRGHREVHSKPAGNVHNIEADNDSSDALALYSDSEEVNAVDRKVSRDKRFKDERKQPEKRIPEASNQTKLVQDTPREYTGRICWNCGKTGHMWRYCREEKRIFCYVCGTPGTTSGTCPNHPRPSQTNMSGN